MAVQVNSAIDVAPVEEAHRWVWLAARLAVWND